MIDNWITAMGIGVRTWKESGGDGDMESIVVSFTGLVEVPTTDCARIARKLGR